MSHSCMKNGEEIPLFLPKHAPMQPMKYESIVRYFVTLLVENHHVASNPFRIGIDSNGNMGVVFDPFGSSESSESEEESSEEESSESSEDESSEDESSEDESSTPSAVFASVVAAITAVDPNDRKSMASVLRKFADSL